MTTPLHIYGLFFFVYCILFAVFAGKIVQWGTGETKSQVWHSYELAVRILPGLMLIAGWIYAGSPFYQYWREVVLYGLFSLNWGWFGFNVIMNLIRGKKWNYVGSSQTGTGSALDKYLNEETVTICYALIFVVTLGFSIYYIIHIA